MVDLMFRDESNHVIKKATGRTNPRGAVKKKKNTSTSASSASGSATATATLTTAFSNNRPKAPRPSPISTTSIKTLSPVTDYGFVHFDPSAVDTPINGYSPSYASAPASGASTPPRPLEQTSFFSMLTPNSAPPTSRSSSESDSSDDTIEVPESSLVRMNYPLSQTLQERGTAFFFSRYVAVDFGCYQNYDFVYDVWKPPRSEWEQVDCVTASMAAVGLAGLSKITRSPETMHSARQSYTQALQLTNAALQDPAEAVKDSTMLSVLILGTYEFITGRTPQTMQAWQNHVNGAAALTRMRGIAPFRTKAGTRMFLMLCHSVLISCIQGGMPMPQAMLDLRDELGQFTDTSDPTWRISAPICRALQIRHDIKIGRLTDTDDIVAQLLEVDDEFGRIVDEMPPSWRYRCAQVNQPNPAILGNWCHIYRGFAQATTWNGMRTIRILVQETILEQLCSSMARTTVPPMRHQMLLVKAMRILELLGEAVIASTPQHFGVVSSRDAKPDGSGKLQFVSATRPPRPIASACPIPSPRPQRHRTPESPGSSPRPTLLDPTQSMDGRGDPNRFMTLASASNTIVWPLYTLGMSSSCTHETRQYIIDRLDAIYVETGLDQARAVKQLIADRVESPPWDSIPLLSLPEFPDEALPAIV